MKIFFSFIWLVVLAIFFCSCSHRESLDSEVIIPHITNARLLKESPGPYLTVVSEVDATLGPNSKLKPSYKLKPQGFHPGDRYFGYRFNANYQQHALGEFVVNDDGDLVWKNLGLTLGTMSLMGSGFLNGEQCFNVFVSEDERQWIVTLITPDPIEYRWEDGAYASLALLEQKKWVFFLVGKGFKPGEEIVLTSIDNDVRIDSIITANAEGMVLFILPPTVAFKDTEKATLTIKRHQQKAIPTLTYLYGRAALVKAMPKKYPTVESVTPEALNKSCRPHTIVKF